MGAFLLPEFQFCVSALQSKEGRLPALMTVAQEVIPGTAPCLSQSEHDFIEGERQMYSLCSLIKAKLFIGTVSAREDLAYSRKDAGLRVPGWESPGPCHYPPWASVSSDGKWRC